MFEAYSIGVTLKLNNLISPQLKLLAEGFEKLDGLTVAFTKSLNKAGRESIGLEAIARTARASATALDRATVAAERLDRGLAAIRVSAAMMPAMPMLPGGGGGSGSGGGRGGNHRGGFHGGNIHVGPGGLGVGTVGLAAGDAFVPLAIAAGIGYGGHALYESAKDLDTERARFRLFGMTEAQNSEAFRYVAGMRVYGSTQAENMRNFREAQGVFREGGLSGSEALAGAKLAAPVLSKLDFLASSLGVESAARMQTANMSMLRYVEMSGGLKDAQTFNRLANFGWRINQSSGGTIDWEQLRQFKARAGTAGYGLDDEALVAMEPVVAELKGGAAGTGMRTSYNRIMGITRLPNQIAHALVDNGLWDKNRVVWNAEGGIKTIIGGNPMSLENSELFVHRPDLFYEKVALPMYARMGLTGAAIERENQAIFGPGTGGAMFNAYNRSMTASHLGLAAFRNQKGIDDSVAEAKGTLSGQEAEFDAAWTDFKTQFGTKMLPFFTGILKGGSEILRVMGDANSSKGLDHVVPGLASYHALSDAYDWVTGANNRKADGASIPTIARPLQSTPQLVGVINLDGHKIASVVFKHGAKDAARPQSGGPRYDPTFGLEPAGG
jgi:hypothetical protein